MSKNTNLSFLTDYITADITNGRIGINNASPTVAFDVSGATRISGTLTLTSTISNGTYTYTLPSSTGTLALTSALSSYLQLTEGTLTGALGGTTATFSGLITGSNQITVGNGVTAANSTINFLGVFGVSYQWSITNDANGLSFNSLVPNTPLKLSATGAATFSSSVTADFLVVGTTAASSGGLRLGTQVAIRARNVANTANIPLIESTAADGVSVSNGALILASTSAATFSSSVTAASFNGTTQNIFSVDGTEKMRILSNGRVGINQVAPPTLLSMISLTPTSATLDAVFNITNDIDSSLRIYVTGSASADKRAAIGPTTNTAFVLQTNTTERMRITSAGDVGIGTSSPSSALDVNGIITGRNVIRYNPASTTSVSTTTTIISTVSNTYGGLAMIWGNDASGNIFTDFIFYSLSAISVLSSQTISGGPSSRTYTTNGSGSLRLAMGSGTYTVRYQGLLV